VIGKIVTMLFAFFLGYGATLAEPALNAMGETVEDVTVGVFKKKLLMQVVAIGVGLGIAAGVAQMAFESLDLTMLLVPPYLLLLVLTLLSSEDFVNFAWDGAGVTTGPITVPLVLAMGLGIGANVPGVIDGFGILALASVGPILTVLAVGLVVSRSRKDEINAVSDEIV
jgi:predicted Na+-dependent transporter